jgi:hypothetical protein
MLSSPPGLSRETAIAPPRRRGVRRLAGAAGALLIIGSACLGGWLGVRAGLWLGHAVGLVRLSLGLGLTAGTAAGLFLGVAVSLVARGEGRTSTRRRFAEQPRVERQREQVL